MSYKSTPHIFGNGYNNYDEHGKKVGETRPKMFGGGYNHYDNRGRKIGETRPGIFGGYNTYDNHGKKVSHTERGLFNNYVTHGPNGKTTVSNRTMSGGYRHSEGCYIATCIYGSYDAPEVLVLRRFRDWILLKNFFGRVFVKTYYFISPKLVKLFGKSVIFRKIWRKILDPIVLKMERSAVKE